MLEGARSVNREEPVKQNGMQYIAHSLSPWLRQTLEPELAVAEGKWPSGSSRWPTKLHIC